MGFPGSSAGKEAACNAGDLGWEDPLEEGEATLSSVLAGRIPWTEEPGRSEAEVTSLTWGGEGGDRETGWYEVAGRVQKVLQPSREEQQGVNKGNTAIPGHLEGLAEVRDWIPRAISLPRCSSRRFCLDLMWWSRWIFILLSAVAGGALLRCHWSTQCFQGFETFDVFISHLTADRS